MTDELPVTERRPKLDNVLRADEVKRCVAPILALDDIHALDLFELDGQSFARISNPEITSIAPAWDKIPDQAKSLLEERKFKRTCLRWRGMPFELRTLSAGADRVGIALYSLGGGDQPDRAKRVTRVVDCIHGVLATLVQSGYATWVTSELHLASSETSYRVLESQHAELKRALEHLREVDKLKSNFLATISHELRTPLTSVIGFAEMLLKEIAGPLNSEQREYVVTIFDRGDELLRLISQLLDMSRMEAGTPQVNFDTSSLDDVVHKAMRTVLIDANRANVTVKFQKPETDLPALSIDVAKVQQILVNLLGNAIKFSPSGEEITIEARLGPRRKPFEGDSLFGEEVDDAVVVSVRDRGIGIAEDQLDKIFEAFYQVNSGATRQHGGAGLGLSIVRKLVEAHHGEVWVESKVGGGTCFSFTLPLDRESASRANTRRVSIGG